MSSVIAFAPSWVPVAVPISSMSARAPGTSGANTTTIGTPSERSCAIASGGLKLEPPAITRSAPRPTIFSTSTEPNFATSGTSPPRAGRRVKSSTLPTTRSPSPSANSVSVAAGVRLTIFCGSAVDLDGRALVVGERDREGGDGRRGRRRAGRRDGGHGRRDRRARCRRRGGGTGAGGDDQRDECDEDRGDGAAATVRGGMTCVHGYSGLGKGENRRPLASGKQGSGGGLHDAPDLSLEGSSGDGRSATGLPPQGAVTVAGLCRNHTGFATIPRRICRDSRPG